MTTRKIKAELLNKIIRGTGSIEELLVEEPVLSIEWGPNEDGSDDNVYLTANNQGATTKEIYDKSIARNERIRKLKSHVKH